MFDYSDFWKKNQNWWLLAKSNTRPNNETNSCLIPYFLKEKPKLMVISKIKYPPQHWNFLRCANSTIPSRVDLLVSEHWSAQARPDSRGGLPCFWCRNKTWTPYLGASNTLRIVENGLEMRKLWPPIVKGSKTQKNKPPTTTKVDPQTPKEFFVLSCYKNSQMICKLSSGTLL